MKPDMTYRFKLPLLHWLFLAFLSSCISYQTNNHHSVKQIARIETVDSLVRGFGTAKRAGYYSFSKKVTFKLKTTIFQIQKIAVLSRKLGDFIKISFIRQSLRIILLPQNIIRHFRSRNLASCAPEDLFS